MEIFLEKILDGSWQSNMYIAWLAIIPGVAINLVALSETRLYDLFLWILASILVCCLLCTEKEVNELDTLR